MVLKVRRCKAPGWVREVMALSRTKQGTARASRTVTIASSSVAVLEVNMLTRLMRPFPCPPR
jgi:hypothetical protein